MLENGCEVCNCKKTKCIRHGKCKECIEHHNRTKSLSPPYCKRPPKKVRKLSG